MSTTDRWGVCHGYEDAEQAWHATEPETRRRIHAAMGVDEESMLEEQQGRVRVLRCDDACRWRLPGQLKLEDGGQVRVTDSLPPDLPIGYHEFLASDADQPMRLILVPDHCPLPEPAWGWSAQLYATRSGQSWGMGDLADLRRLAQWSVGLGAGMLMVNPLGAPTPLLPQQPSPYYPSSRRFFNPLYLRVEEVPGATQFVELDRLAAQGRALNANRDIDRDAVFALKDRALRAIWERFAGDKAFDRFCQQQGQDLDEFAAYCVLTQRHGGNWRQWPAEYQRPDSQAVRDLARDNAREVGYHRWLQWLLDRQLAAASAVLPLVQDLPIGVDPAGVDAWMWQDLLATECTVGAPPDLFNRQGQNWGLPPFIPHRLRAAGYQPYVETFRAAMRNGGGLRIDHVMGLFRLYWIPEGFGPDRGTYVRYPAEDLLGIVALEAHRAGAFVVGEDLGTVEPRVRKELAAHRILSFRLLWFEEERPAKYPELAMAAITTHDLPTIAGLFTGHDLAEQRSLGLAAEKAMGELREHFFRIVGIDDRTPLERAIEQTHRVLGGAPSRLLLATLEDALAVEERPNVPGVTSERRPNWSLALPGGLEALEQSELAKRIAEALTRPPGKHRR